MSGKKNIYSLNDTDGRSLVSQLCERIKEAVRSGALKKGEQLPSIRQLAELAGVSVKVPREAIARLSAEGLLMPRRGIGTVVAGSRKAWYRGRVLLVYPSGEVSFYVNALLGVVNQSLIGNGYYVSSLAVRRKRNGGFDFGYLRQHLACGDFTFAFVLMYEDTMAAPLAEARLPYVACSLLPIKHSGSVAHIQYSHKTVVPEFITHCLRRGVKSVLQLIFDRAAMDVTPDMARHGIQVETLQVCKGRLLEDFEKLETIQREAMKTMLWRLARGSLPDLVFAADDFIAQGVLSAFAAHGIRVPEDVKMVVWANRGFGPVAACSFTRMEMDPFRHGKLVSSCILDCLSTGKKPKNITLGPDYIIGESFG